jgi:hypothetical protein
MFFVKVIFYGLLAFSVIVISVFIALIIILTLRAVFNWPNPDNTIATSLISLASMMLACIIISRITRFFFNRSNRSTRKNSV